MEFEKISHRGNLDDCIADLLHRIQEVHGEKKGIFILRDKFSEYCDVHKNTARKWIDPLADVEIQVPTKVQLIALLESLGYEVTEVLRLQDPVRRGFKVVGMKIVSIETFLDTVGFKRPNSFFRIFSEPSSGTKEDKAQKMRSMWVANKDRIAEAEKVIQQWYLSVLYGAHESNQGFEPEGSSKEEKHKVLPLNNGNTTPFLIFSLMETLNKVLGNEDVFQKILQSASFSEKRQLILQLSSKMNMLGSKVYETEKENQDE